MKINRNTLIILIVAFTLSMLPILTNLNKMQFDYVLYTNEWLKIIVSSFIIAGILFFLKEQFLVSRKRYSTIDQLEIGIKILNNILIALDSNDKVTYPFWMKFRLMLPEYIEIYTLAEKVFTGTNNGYLLFDERKIKSVSDLLKIYDARKNITINELHEIKDFLRALANELSSLKMELSKWRD